MRVLLGVLAGATVTYCAAAYGHVAGPPAGPESVVCHRYLGGIGFECTYPDPPGVKTSYSIRMPGIDLVCDLRGPGEGLKEALTCFRQSRRPGAACVNGALGGLSVYVTSTELAVSTPRRCVKASNPLGFTITRPGRATRFARNP